MSLKANSGHWVSFKNYKLVGVSGDKFLSKIIPCIRLFPKVILSHFLDLQLVILGLAVFSIRVV
jgi:hypothetical protein